MIAQRFSAIGWVAGVATAACGLYLVSLQVAAERGKLESVERQIAAAERDMRQLQTELGTRASMRQLEKWNGDVLALSTPRANQFLKGDVQLASLDLSTLGKDGGVPPPAMNAATPKEDKIAPATGTAEFQRAPFVRPSEAPRLQKVAFVEPTLLRDLNVAAAEEHRTRP